MVERYDAIEHSDEILELSRFLSEPGHTDSEHDVYCLNALEAIVKDGKTLPVETLDILSTLVLRDDIPIENRERCCDILAYSACNDQPLPLNVIRALETVLEKSDASLCSIAASALNRAFLNGQTLTKNIVLLVESAFIRHKNNREDLSFFLYELVSRSKDQHLSPATFEELACVILDNKQNTNTANGCNIIAASAKNGQCIPGIVWDALESLLENPLEPVKERALRVLMACVTDEKSRANITPLVLTKIINSLDQALLSKNLKIRRFAACIIGHLITDDPSKAEELQRLTQMMDVKGAPSIQRTLFINCLLDEALEDPQLCQYAVLPLHHLLSQGNFGLPSEALAVLSQIGNDQNLNLELRKKAIEVIGLSARKNDLSNEIDLLIPILKTKKPELVTAGLKALSNHLDSLLGVKELPHKIIKPVMVALNHEDTALDAIKIIKTVVDESTESDKFYILKQFLLIAKDGLLKISLHNELLQDEVRALLAIANHYHPKDTKKMLDTLDALPEEEIDSAKELPTQDINLDAKKATTADRTEEQLFSLLKKDNKDNDAILKLLQEGTFLNNFKAIDDASKNESVLLPLKKPITQWDKDDCLQWAKTLKTQPKKAQDPAFLAEMIAVLSQGNFLITTHHTRTTQLFSLLLLLDAKDHGRLAEIATGEGKSTIVAMLAAIKALQGEKVDVVSSSPLLAFRDAEEKAPFFKLFDLTAASNWDPNGDNKASPGPKACYMADIVYSDTNNFQFDLLRHEYRKEETRGKEPNARPYETVIVDEVDSMFIDASMNFASLGSQKPLMEDLEHLFSYVWVLLTATQEDLREGRISLPIDDKTGKPITKAKYLTSLLEKYILQIINDPDHLVPIPKHLEAFATSQASHWAKSAVLASENFILGRDYVITTEDGHEIIAPVDYMNTGVTHANSVWDDGLQQFLQHKEGLKFSAENLTASFISNRAFFKRYGKNIYGLTGTLGAKDAQDLLKEVYELDLAFIPTYKEKRPVEIPGFLAETSDEWLQKVVATVKQEIESGRAALVICESINAAHAIEEALKRANIKKIRCYTRSDSDENAAIAQKVDSGEVIIATNLAGRGTDVKTTDAVENKGGLHVCVTFLPNNLRVEQQAFGRTSRQGNKGTAQLIINKEEAVARLAAYPELGNAASMEALKEWRNAVEEKILQVVKDIELPKLIIKDKLFAEFCKFTNALRAIDKNDSKLDEVEEQWGFWLKNINRTIFQKKTVNETKLMKKFAKFKQKAEQRFNAGEMDNPSQWVKLGNHSHDPRKFRSVFRREHPTLEQAKTAYSKAINQDPQSLAAAQAHYRLAYLYIFNQDKGMAITELTKAQALLKDHIIPKLETLLQLLYLNANHRTAANVDQVQDRIQLLKLQIAHINRDIYVLEHAERDIEIIGSKKLDSFFNSSNSPNDEIRELYNVGLPHLYDIREKEKEKESGLGAWLRRAFVAIAGVCQIIVGACLTATGNPFWGQVLIQMGVSDIMFAVRSAIENTSCSWEEYRAHKIISTAIIVLTMGFNLRHGTEAVKQATFGEVIRTQVIQAIQIGIIKEGIHLGLSAVARGVIADYKEDIKSSIRRTILAHFNQPNFQQQIDKILYYGKDDQGTRLKNVAQKILHPKRNALANMGESILKGVIANQVPGAELAIKARELAAALAKINNICDDFCDEFSSKLPSILYDLAPEEGQKGSIPDQSAARNSLYNSIIDDITRSVVSCLHTEFVTPILDTVVNTSAEKWASGLGPKEAETISVAPTASSSQLANSSEVKISASAPAKKVGRVSNSTRTLPLPAGIMENAIEFAKQAPKPRTEIKLNKKSPKIPGINQNKNTPHFFSESNKKSPLSIEKGKESLLHDTILQESESTNPVIVPPSKSSLSNQQQSGVAIMEFYYEYLTPSRLPTAPLMMVRDGLLSWKSSNQLEKISANYPLLGRSLDHAASAIIAPIEAFAIDVPHVMNHPYDSVIKPTAVAIWDIATIASAHLPEVYASGAGPHFPTPIYMGNEDVTSWTVQDVYQRIPNYQNAVRRMQERKEEVVHCVHNVEEASGPERTRMVVRMGTNFFLMHEVVHTAERGGSFLKAMLRSPRKKGPGFFSTFVEGVVDNELIGTSVAEVVRVGDTLIEQGVQLTEKGVDILKPPMEITERLQSVKEAIEGDEVHQSHAP